MVIQKENIHTVNCSLICILCLNDKFVTAHNKCLKIPPLTSMQFVTHVQRLHVVRPS